MTQIYSKFEDIRTFLDDMIESEKAKKAQLTSQIEELKKQDSTKSSSTENGTLKSLIKDDDVALHFGTKSFKKLINSKKDINDLYSLSQINLGTNDIGFKDDNDNGSVTSLRTSQDLKYAFSIYFVEKLSFLHIVALKNEDAEALKKFNLRKENMNKNDDCAVFRVQLLGPDSTLIFLAISLKYSKQEGIAYLQSMFGNISELTFVDEDNDEIDMNTNEAWDYCIKAAVSMNKKGKYPHLTIIHS